MKKLLFIPLLFFYVGIVNARGLQQSINSANVLAKRLLDNQLKGWKNVSKKYHGFRPKSCPIHPKKYDSINEKIQSILNNLNNIPKCKENVAGSMANIQKSISDFDNLFTQQREYTAVMDNLRIEARGGDVETKTPEQIMSEMRDKHIHQKINIINRTMSNLTNIAANYECKESLTASGGLDLMADIVLGTSNMGLFFPGGYGSAVAAGGHVVGSLLKIINLLLQYSWNFKIEEDRNNFVKLNCSFFDLKSEMDRVGILEVKTKENDEEIKKLQKNQDSITRQIVKLQNEIAKENKRLKLKEKINVMARLSAGNKKYDGLKNVELFYKFKNIRNILNDDALRAKTDDKKAEILIKLFNEYKEMISLINDPSINMGTTGRVLHFPKVEKEYKKILNGATSSDQLWKTILKKGEYKKFIENFLKPVDWLIAHQLYVVNQGSFARLVKDPRIKAQIVIFRLKNLYDSYEERKKFVINIKNGTLFEESAEGTQIKANIILGFNKIENIIYGKIGRGFLDYSTKEGSWAENKFKKQYKRINVENVRDNSECPNAINSRRNYQLAESLTQVAYDFIATNKDSFFDPKSRLRYLKGTKAYSQSVILNHVKSVKEAEKLIKANGGSFPASKKNPLYKRGLWTPVGSMMIRLKQSYPDVQKIQSYINAKHCASKRDKR